MKKRFVSLFFTSKKLQVLQLNAKKNFVKKYTTVDLPEGLIINYKVQDKKTLATILQDVWKRLGLKEKSVGVVVPEFSTFTKSLILPPLEAKELDEAVRWQSRDFLISGNGQMVMDWKVVQKQKEDLRILSVAMQKELLLSFVDAVGEAGLFPLAVETPSLSLVRISDNDLSPKLVVYANFGEAVLVLASGEEILGSSVVSSRDQQGILWTAKHMIEHYFHIKIERIEVGGLELSQQLVGDLQKTLGKPSHWIQTNIGGLTAKQIQEYLVPISLQFKDPAEPLDETTINLLPSEWVKYYEDKKMKRQTQSLMMVVSLIIWGSFLGSLGANLSLVKQIKSFEKDRAIQAIAIPTEITTQINQINKLADKIVKITSLSKSPQEVINILNQARPAGVNLFEYQLDLDDGKILLKGRAVDRQALINFKQALEANKDFSKVNIPISTFEVGENLEFEIRFFYGQGSTKKAIKIPIK